MAKSYETYPGDGVQTDWSVPFNYLDQDHVKVYVNGAEVAHSWPSPNTVTVTPAAAQGATVMVRRVTPTAPLTSFSNTNNLTADNLNLAALQSLFVAEEAADASTDATEDADAAVSTATTADAKATTALSNSNTAVTNAATALTTANSAAAVAADAHEMAEEAAQAASVHVAADLPFDDTAAQVGATNVQAVIEKIAAAAGVGELTSDTVDNASAVTGASVSDALETLAADVATVAASVTALDGEVDSALATKANAADVTTALATKANAADVTTALAGKQESLGFTPVNKAGDTINGELRLSRTGDGLGVLRLGTGNDYLYVDSSHTLRYGENIVNHSGNNPTLQKVESGRLTYAGDTNAAMADPWGGAVITCQMAANTFRYRYLQLYRPDLGWFTCGYA